MSLTVTQARVTLVGVPRVPRTLMALTWSTRIAALKTFYLPAIVANPSTCCITCIDGKIYRATLHCDVVQAEACSRLYLNLIRR